ncbi:MAG: hypothetical protein R3Y24_11365 [Eubacteriales bacterium]
MSRLTNYIKYIKYIVFIALYLIICFSGLGNKEADWALKQYLLSDFTIEEEVQENIVMDETNIDKGGVLVLTEENTTFRGEVATTPIYYFEKGSYIFAIEYETDNEANYCEVFSATTLDEEGNLGKVYARYTLDPSEDRIRMEVEFEQDVINIQVRVFYEEGSLTVKEGALRTISTYNDTYFYIAVNLIVLIGMVVIFLWNKKKYKQEDKILAIIFVGGLTIASSLPILNDFLIHGHDLQFHLARIEGTYRGLITGQFPVRINTVQTVGYGYASPVMYPQLFIYLAAALRLVGVSLITSYKALLIVINLLTVIISYFVAKRITNSTLAGLVGSTLYTMSIYRLIDLYTRAALGEVLAIAFLPLIIYGMYEILVGNEKKWIWATLGYTFVFQSHLLSVELAAAFSVIALVTCILKVFKEKARMIALIKAATLTVIINLWTIIPLLSFSRLDFMIFDADRDLQDSGLYLIQLFSTFMGTTGKNKSLGIIAGEMPLSVGGIFFVGILFFAYVQYEEKKKNDVSNMKLIQLGNWMLLLGSVSLYLSTNFFPWQLLQTNEILNLLISPLQFPWRLLGFATLFFTITSIIGVRIYVQNKGATGRVITFAMCMVIVASSMYFIDGTMQVETVYDKGELADTEDTDPLYLYNGDALTTYSLRGEAVTASEGSQIKLLNYQKEGLYVSVDVVIKEYQEGAYVEVPLYAYPVYSATYNGVEIDVMRGTDNVVRVMIPNEDGELCVFYEEPFLWKIGNIISLVSIVAWVVYEVLKRMKKKS